MQMVCHSVAETYALGRRLGRLAARGQCVALHGPLGAGKTHLVRGVAQGAQVADPDLVSSPTYVLLNIYPADPGNPESKTVFHLDAYRTHGAEDMQVVGFEELLHEEGVVVVEWAERIPELLPSDHLAIAIEPADESIRAFTLTPSGPRSATLVAALAAEVG